MKRTSRSDPGRFFLRLSGIGIAVLILLAYIAIRTVIASYALHDQVTILVTSNPVHIISLDRKDKSIAAVTLLPEYVISGLYKYGQYSIESLWKLGRIDKKPLLLKESLQDAVGLPIDLYIAEHSNDIRSVSDVRQAVSDYFSPRNWLGYMIGSYDTDMSLFTVIALYIDFMSVSPSDVRTFDITAYKPYSKELQADGSVRSVLDPDKIDGLFRQMFENAQIRTENISITLVNTTEIPVVASRVARMLGRIGVVVVSIDTERSDVRGCEVRGPLDYKDSVTVKRITDVLHCTFITDSSRNASDLVVHIGSDYAQRFDRGL